MGFQVIFPEDEGDEAVCFKRQQLEVDRGETTGPSAERAGLTRGVIGRHAGSS